MRVADEPTVSEGGGPSEFEGTVNAVVAGAVELEVNAEEAERATGGCSAEEAKRNAAAEDTAELVPADFSAGPPAPVPPPPREGGP